MMRVQPAVSGDAGDDSAGGVAGAGKMDVSTVAFDGSLELFEIIIEIVQRVLFDVASEGPQAVGIGQFQHALQAAIVLPLDI